VPAPRLVQISTFAGAVVILGTAACLMRPRLRRLAIVVGCTGMTAGALAALVYTLSEMARGLDVDSVPHEACAQWFVAAFGWAGLATALLAAVVPSLKALLNGPPLRPHGR
jgi:hypothetical protein